MASRKVVEGPRRLDRRAIGQGLAAKPDTYERRQHGADVSFLFQNCLAVCIANEPVAARAALEMRGLVWYTQNNSSLIGEK